MQGARKGCEGDSRRGASEVRKGTRVFERVARRFEKGARGFERVAKGSAEKHASGFQEWCKQSSIVVRRVFREVCEGVR